MSKEQWTAVDDYFADLLIAPDPALEAALQTSADAGIPAIQVSPHQGKLLLLLARIQRARTILEIGTLAVTAPSGWRARCRRTAAWSRWRSTRSTPSWRGPTSRVPD
jgi:hypothetical protein